MKQMLSSLILFALPIVLSAQCYEVYQRPYYPDPYSGGASHSLTDDSFTSLVDIGFPFCFFGDTVTQCIISSNGYISFDLSNAGGYSPWAINDSIPNATLPRFSVMGPYQDINPSSGGAISTSTYGVAPYRRFVVSYDSIAMFNCTNLHFTNQIVLFESANIIDINIANKPLCVDWNNGVAIEGIHNQDGTEAHVVPGRNHPTQWDTQLDSYRFIPVCDCPSDSLPDFGVVPGKVYWDEDGDCEQDPDELLLANIRIDIEPGGGIAWTNQNGEFALMMAEGNYTFEHSPQNPWYYSNLCEVGGIPVTVIADSNALDVCFGDSVVPIIDLATTISSNAINACFANTQTVSVCNYGTVPATDVEVLVQIPDFTGTSNFDFTATADSTFELTIPILQAGQCLNYLFSGTANCDSSMIGQVACMSSSVSSPQVDADTTNNEMTFCDSVGVSYDPNDIRVLSQQQIEGWRYQEYIENDDELIYMVRFQNTGTGPAYNVIVKNPVSDFLDHQSVELIASSHTNFTQLLDGELSVHFLGIELPDSASDPSGSQGFFIYRVEQNLGNVPGTLIENQADIYFDFNAPVATNITENEILLVSDIDEHSSEDEFILYPNPTTGPFSIVSRNAKRTIQSVRVYDPSGRLVLVDMDNEIDLSQIETGIYFVEIESEYGTQVKRLLKN